MKDYLSTIKKIILILLFLVLILQLITVFLMELKSDIIEEIHEISGFSFFGLIFIHILLYWKNIKVIFTPIFKKD